MLGCGESKERDVGNFWVKVLEIVLECGGGRGDVEKYVGVWESVGEVWESG